VTAPPLLSQVSNLTWYITLVALITALLIGIVIVKNVWRDLKEKEEPPPDPEELLGPLADAFAAGQMSEEEYARIRESVKRVATPRAADAPGQGSEGRDLPRSIKADDRPPTGPATSEGQADVPA
jgi:hypothetical protein